MALKRNHLYLFLALACFVSIIAIFIFDGYIGVYDKLVIDNGQYKQTIEADQWIQQTKFGNVVGTSLEQNNQVDFIYTIENHRFSEYTDTIEVSVWSNKVKTADLLSEKVLVPSFDKQEFKWTVTAADILPPNYSVNQSYFVNIKIKMSDIERDINVNIYVNTNTIKIPPVPASR
jgi:hypothetical protein